jgi:hypothetical protein
LEAGLARFSFHVDQPIFQWIPMTTIFIASNDLSSDRMFGAGVGDNRDPIHAAATALTSEASLFFGVLTRC